MLLLIAGITGHLGQRLAQAAIDVGHSVRGLSRSPEKLNQDVLARLESFIRSESIYDLAAIEKATEGVDGILCAYQAGPLLNIDGGLLLLRAAERAGVKIFVAPTWNSNWTRINYGDFELYDSVKAFADQAAATSTIRPVYIINGFFADYFFAPGFGPFDADGKSAKFFHWGDLHKRSIPWTPMDDAARWTIELLRSPEIAGGNGGVFQFQSGANTLEELAQVYEEVSGTKIEFVCEGTAEELASALAIERKEKGRFRWAEYLWLAWSHIALQGLWELQDPIVLESDRKATTFAQVLHRRGVSKSP